jgi:hypothetical protein
LQYAECTQAAQNHIDGERHLKYPQNCAEHAWTESSPFRALSVPLFETCE